MSIIAPHPSVVKPRHYMIFTSRIAAATPMMPLISAAGSALLDADTATVQRKGIENCFR